MSFGKPCRDRGSESLMVNDFDLFKDVLVIILSEDNIISEDTDATAIHSPSYLTGKLKMRDFIDSAGAWLCYTRLCQETAVFRLVIKCSPWVRLQHPY